eukprot:5632680-Amphidinium_carterae.1
MVVVDHSQLRQRRQHQYDCVGMALLGATLWAEWCLCKSAAACPNFTRSLAVLLLCLALRCQDGSVEAVVR